MTPSQPPLVAHVLLRLDYGGLENGLVNLINGLPDDEFRHAIVCIDDYTDFRQRIRRDDVEVIAIHKQPGTDLGALKRLYRTFRDLRPDIVHTRNLPALDALVPSFLAGVRRRVHSEHGWDVHDLDGSNRKHQWLRRLHSPLVHRYIALSKHLERYLVDRVGISERRVTQVYNGVDTDRFARSGDGRPAVLAERFGDDAVLIGSVGRMQAVKDPLNLVEAFVLLCERTPDIAERVGLAMIGGGPLEDDVRSRLDAAGLGERAWLPGGRDDIPVLLGGLDIYVQPSLAEGISNTILEAMASGLPVVATDVGGNAELGARWRNGHHRAVGRARRHCGSARAIHRRCGGATASWRDSAPARRRGFRHAGHDGELCRHLPPAAGRLTRPLPFGAGGTNVLFFSIGLCLQFRH